MDMKGFQSYKEQSVNTMTQGELLLLLYDELYKRLSQAELMLDQQNYPVYESSIERSVAIIDYLDSTLDRQYPISKTWPSCTSILPMSWAGRKSAAARRSWIM